MMQGEPAGPSSQPDDVDEMAVLLRRQVTRLRRWVAWECWLREPRSFAPPEESEQDDDIKDN